MGSDTQDCSCGLGNPEWVMSSAGDGLVAPSHFNLKKMIVLVLWDHAQVSGHLSDLLLRSLGKAELGCPSVDRQDKKAVTVEDGQQHQAGRKVPVMAGAMGLAQPFPIDVAGRHWRCCPQQVWCVLR